MTNRKSTPNPQPLASEVAPGECGICGTDFVKDTKTGLGYCPKCAAPSERDWAWDAAHELIFPDDEARERYDDIDVIEAAKVIRKKHAERPDPTEPQRAEAPDSPTVLRLYEESLKREQLANLELREQLEQAKQELEKWKAVGRMNDEEESQKHVAAPSPGKPRPQPQTADEIHAFLGTQPWANEFERLVSELLKQDKAFVAKVLWEVFLLGQDSAAMPPAQSPQWISVSERLPETTGVYATYPPEKCDTDMGLTFAPRYFVANEHRNVYAGAKLAYGWTARKEHLITHWQPLPGTEGDKK